MMKIPVSRGFVYSSSPIFALFHRMERKFQRTECMFLRLERTFHGMEYKSFRVKKNLSSRERQYQSRMGYGLLHALSKKLSEIIASRYADRYSLLAEIIKQMTIISKKA